MDRDSAIQYVTHVFYREQTAEDDKSWTLLQNLKKAHGIVGANVETAMKRMPDDKFKAFVDAVRQIDGAK